MIILSDFDIMGRNKDVNINKYQLYYTLNSTSDKNELSKSQLKQLEERLNSLDQRQTEAVLMLIVEHSRVHPEDGVAPLEENLKDIKLPYGGEQVEGNVHFPFEQIPIALQRILWKFTEVVSSQKS